MEMTTRISDKLVDRAIDAIKCNYQPVSQSKIYTVFVFVKLNLATVEFQKTLQKNKKVSSRRSSTLMC